MNSASNSPHDSTRRGIVAGGNFIVDSVNVVDHWPAESTLATILSETTSNGGSPYNILKDLAAMQAPFPLAAVGLLGSDPQGDWILKDCANHGIDTAQLRRTRESPTSCTHAMTVQSSGRRTFFHKRGANALLDVDHFDFSQCTARLFHLGFLILLDRLDSFASPGRTRASLVLERAKAAGLETSVDAVSTAHPHFREIVCSSLPFTDHLLINEIEAGAVLGKSLDVNDIPQLCDAVTALLALGVRQSASIHFEGGAVSASRDGAPQFQPSLRLPPGFNKGASGAGDAFAAGYLYGVHERWPLNESLRLAVSAAALCLSDPTTSGGLRPVSDCLALYDRYGADEGACLK